MFEGVPGDLRRDPQEFPFIMSAVKSSTVSLRKLLSGAAVQIFFSSQEGTEAFQRVSRESRTFKWVQ